MTYPDFKKKKLEEFDENCGGVSCCKYHTDDIYKAFLTQALDELLVEVEKAVVPEEDKHEKHSDDKSWCIYCGFNIARKDLIQALSSFKGE